MCIRDRNEKKKFVRLSQKEKKRLSQEAAAVVEEDSPSPDKSAWGGWATISSSATQSPSLKEIMSKEVSPPPYQEIVKEVTPKSQAKPKETPPRSQSKHRSKSEKKTSWRKIDLNSSASLSCESPSPVKMNPWKLPSQPQPSQSPEKEIHASETADRSFEQIMKEDHSKEEELIRVQSKPLQITQIEEKAIEELKQFYNVDTCRDETITVERVKKGALATPVWKKNRKL